MILFESRHNPRLMSVAEFTQGRKFYKMLHWNEVHYGMHYKTGLNVDIVPFKPFGACSPGGIYFSSCDNILNFLSQGTWFREVTIPENARVYAEKGKWKADRIILGERCRVTADSVLGLIDQGARTDIFFNSSVTDIAMRDKSIELLKKLPDQKYNAKLYIYHLIRTDNMDFLPEVLGVYAEYIKDIDVICEFLEYSSGKPALFAEVLRAFYGYIEDIKRDRRLKPMIKAYERSQIQ